MSLIGIIGNGPSALFLSFILNGNIPYYDPETVHGRHPDLNLHEMLLKYTHPYQSLLEAVNDEEILAYVETSYKSFFSSTMLPINLLFDTLVSSDETDFASLNYKQSRINWRKETAKPHLILGASSLPGGQWSSEHPETDDPNIKTLSYAEMLSLPTFPFSVFYREKYGRYPEEYFRPTRQDMSDYLAAYPKACGLANNIISDSAVTCVDRKSSDEFIISYLHHGQQHSVTVSSLVLATGVFESPLKSSIKHDSFSEWAKILTQKSGSHSHTLTPPLATPPSEDPCAQGPSSTLVLGSGVSAAEAINIGDDEHPVVHIFRWDYTSQQPCPLKKFPKELYPEYSNVYQLMKQSKRDDSYEAMPNAQVTDLGHDGVAEILLENGDIVTRKFGKIKLRTGRNGSLQFLAPNVLGELNLDNVSKTTFRKHAESSKDNNLAISTNVYIVGSLTGDTLMRFLLGGCAWVAGNLK